MAAFGMDILTVNTLLFPKTRTEWWLNKINGNIAHDAKAIKALKKEGWKIIKKITCFVF